MNSKNLDPKNLLKTLAVLSYVLLRTDGVYTELNSLQNVTFSETSVSVVKVGKSISVGSVIKGKTSFVCSPFTDRTVVLLPDSTLDIPPEMEMDLSKDLYQEYERVLDVAEEFFFYISMYTKEPEKYMIIAFLLKNLRFLRIFQMDINGNFWDEDLEDIIKLYSPDLFL